MRAIIKLTVGKFVYVVRGKIAHIALYGDDILCGSNADIWNTTTIYDPAYKVCKKCARKYYTEGGDLPRGLNNG